WWRCLLSALRGNSRAGTGLRPQTSLSTVRKHRIIARAPLNPAPVKGFYLQYEDEQTPDLIKQWSVQVIKVRGSHTVRLQTRLQVSRSKRHLDATAALNFWQCLDDFVARSPRLHFLQK